MSTIWKIPLGDFTVNAWKEHRLPGVDATMIRALGYQGGNPMMWVEVIPGALLQSLDTIVIGTGWDVPHNSRYVGTLIEPPEGEFVWHVYAR